MNKMQLKQVIIMRADLNLPKGKMAAQSAHASVEAVLKADKETISVWRRNGSKKIVLKVSDKESVYKYIQEAKDLGLCTSIITDAGKTTIAPGTLTCGAIGPADESIIDRITGKLPMI